MTVFFEESYPADRFVHLIWIMSLGRSGCVGRKRCTANGTLMRLTTETNLATGVLMGCARPHNF